MKNERHIPLGDSHFGKKVELVLDGKNKYIVKPRTARVEKALEAFLLALKQEGFPFIPSCEHIIKEGKDWFWSEYIEYRPAENQGDIKLYFNRCGALLFLTYLLGTTDLHMENIIACKDTPVIIDAETLMKGRMEKNIGLVSLTDTVACSHLLPIIWKPQNGELLQQSGLFSSENDSRNLLRYKENVCEIYRYKDEVLEGFEAAYRFTLNHIDMIFSAMDCFESCTFRMILRPTEYYGRFMELLDRFPEKKRMPVAQMLLANAYTNDIRNNRLEEMKQVLDKEVEAIVGGDVPYFSVGYESHDLFCGEETVKKGFLCLSPKECVKERLDGFCVDDLEAQKRIIEQSIDAVTPITNQNRKISDISVTEKAETKGYDLIEVVFDKLEEKNISTLSAGWIKLQESMDGNIYLQSAGFGLYNGMLGILCAYAAFYYKTKDEKYLQALMKHYEKFRIFIASVKNSIHLNNGSGQLQEGIGGMINALLHICELTKKECFYQDTIELFGKLQTTLEGECEDILCGSAGIALTLPKLPKEKALPIAEALYSKLALYEPKLTGAAHGAAGIALAIAAVQYVLNKNDLDKKIIELISFENDYYDEASNNWRDLRDMERVAFMNGWCSGVGGIAMTRKRIMELTRNDTIKELCRRDINRAKANLSLDLILKRDCLCCGNSARLMVLSYIGEQNDFIYEQLENRLKNDGLFLVHRINTCDNDLGLMQGLAGVGYALAMYGDEKCGRMLL